MLPPASMKRKVSLESLGLGRSSYKDQFPQYANMRNERYSSQTNRNYSYDNSNIRKANVVPKNLNKTFTINNRDLNKSVDYSVSKVNPSPYKAHPDISNQRQENMTYSQPEQLPTIAPSAAKESRAELQLNKSIDFQVNQEKLIPNGKPTRAAESPNIIKNYKQSSSRANNKMYDSLDQHMNNSTSKPMTQKDLYEDNSSPYTRFVGATREDVKRNSLEQDRYFSRLTNMNSKQMQIYQKHLEHHLIPIKDKEKKLEEMERKKREETKKKLDELEQGKHLLF